MIMIMIMIGYSVSEWSRVWLWGKVRLVQCFMFKYVF